MAEQDWTFECRGINQTHILELIIYSALNKLFDIERHWVKTTGKDQEEEDSSEPTLVPASGSFMSGRASWGCNVPLITQALGNYATGFTLASQSHRRACGFTHGHLKASAHSFFLEVDFFFFFSSFVLLLNPPIASALVWCSTEEPTDNCRLAGDY